MLWGFFFVHDFSYENIWKPNAYVCMSLNIAPFPEEELPLVLITVRKTKHGISTCYILSSHRYSTQQDSKRKQKVEHFQHTCWPNKGTPSNLQAVLDLLLLVQRSQQNAGNAPMLVQCRCRLDSMLHYVTFLMKKGIEKKTQTHSSDFQTRLNAISKRVRVFFLFPFSSGSSRIVFFMS